MSAELELEQRMLDMGDELKDAVVSVSQALVDLAEKLAGDEAKLQTALEAIAKAVPALAKQESVKPLADAIAQALKGLSVNVTVEATMPAHPPQPPATVTIEAAKEWRATHTYDLNGRLTGSTLKRIA